MLKYRARPLYRTAVRGLLRYQRTSFRERRTQDPSRAWTHDCIIGNACASLGAIPTKIDEETVQTGGSQCQSLFKCPNYFLRAGRCEARSSSIHDSRVRRSLNPLAVDLGDGALGPGPRRRFGGHLPEEQSLFVLRKVTAREKDRDGRWI